MRDYTTIARAALPLADREWAIVYEPWVGGGPYRYRVYADRTKATRVERLHLPLDCNGYLVARFGDQVVVYVGPQTMGAKLALSDLGRRRARRSRRP